MDQNQQLILLLLIGAAVYYYLENEKKVTSTSGENNKDNDNKDNDNDNKDNDNDNKDNDNKDNDNKDNDDDNDDNNDHEIQGRVQNVTNLDGFRRNVKSKLECYNLAQEAGVLGYEYRKDNYRSFFTSSNTCQLLTGISWGEPTKVTEAVSGCVDKSKSFKKGCLNYTTGFRNGGTSVEGQDQIAVENIQECQQRAKLNNIAKGYIYRTNNHPQEHLKKTCNLLSSMGTGDLIAKNDHITGCADISKNEENNCE